MIWEGVAVGQQELIAVGSLNILRSRWLTQEAVMSKIHLTAPHSKWTPVEHEAEVHAGQPPRAKWHQRRALRTRGLLRNLLVYITLYNCSEAHVGLHCKAHKKKPLPLFLSSWSLSIVRISGLWKAAFNDKITSLSRLVLFIKRWLQVFLCNLFVF